MEPELYSSKQLRELMKDRRNNPIHEATGVSLSTISTIRMGHHGNVSEDVLKRLTDYFNK